MSYSAVTEAAAVRAELQRIIASPPFADADRLVRFLTFVVEQTLAGQGGGLKESVIGVEVFGRPTGYDPKIDPIVRVQARRLRAKLEAHYAAFGRPGELQIVLAKGGYIPEFCIAPQPEPPAVEAPPPLPETVADKPRGISWKLLAFGALGAAAVVIALLFRSHHNVVRPVDSRLITAYPGYQNTPAFSPDGQTIAFSWGGPEGGRPNIYLQRLNADTPTRLANSPTRDRQPAWLPDGQHISFLRDDGADRVAVIVSPVVGAGEQRVATLLADLTNPPHIGWSHDGKKLYASEPMALHAQQRIVEIDLASGQRRNLTHLTSATKQTVPGDDEVALSPNGRMIAFRRRIDSGSGEVFVAQIGGEARQITRDNSGIVGLAWTRDSKSLIVSSRRFSSLTRLWRFPIDGGEPAALTDASLSASFPSVSPRDGSVVFASRYLTANIWRIDLTGKTPAQRVIASDLLDSTPQYSPDGAKIAFRSNRSGNDEVWVTGSDGKSPVRLTDYKGVVTGSAHWSPDGQYLVFDSRPNGNSDILLVAASGGPVRQITNEPSNEVLPHFSGDGKFVFFASDRTGVWQIWKQPLDGGPARQITRDRGFASQESADHQWLYYSKPDANGLFRMPLGGGEETCVLPSLPPSAWGAWALAGDKLVYFSTPDTGGNGDPVELRMRSLSTGKTSIVTTTKFPPVRWDGALAVSPDAHFALVALIEREGSEIHLQTEQ